MPLLGDAVLGACCIGHVERCAEVVPVGLRESDPAADQPLLPLRFGHVFDFGVGDRERLELIPGECPEVSLGVG